MKTIHIIVGLLGIVVSLTFLGCTVDDANPMEASIYNDTIVEYDSTVTHDTVMVHDTVIIHDTITVIDSMIVPGDTCTDDVMIYKKCLILEKCKKTITLGPPDYRMKISRKKVNGHGLDFCLEIKKTKNGYIGELSVEHLKNDWPIVYVEISVNNTIFTWKLDQESQTFKFVF